MNAENSGSPATLAVFNTPVDPNGLHLGRSNPALTADRNPQTVQVIRNIRKRFSHWVDLLLRCNCRQSPDFLPRALPDVTTYSLKLNSRSSLLLNFFNRFCLSIP
jgi:hypothetical protein